MEKLLSALKIPFVATSCLLVFSTMAAAQKYSDYPADAMFSGKASAPKYSQNDGSAMFKSEIRDGVKAGINFAGQYSVIEIGCGSSCLNAYVVNMQNGKIIKFPLGGELNYELMLEYNSKSRLIKAIWKDDEVNEAKGCVIDFFEIANDKFKKVSSSRKPVKDYYCDAYMD